MKELTSSPPVSVHYVDLKPLANSYIQQLVQVKWGLAVHGRDLSWNQH